MIIDKGKTYTIRGGESVRILATDGPDVNYPVIALIGHEVRMYSASGEASAGLMCGLAVGRSGYSLIESDPHGILPRHRELLASELEAYETHSQTAMLVRNEVFSDLACSLKAALIALARLEKEKS